MPEWAQGLVVFTAVVGMMYLACSILVGEWLFLPKRSRDLPYRQYTQGKYQGQIYVPQPQALHRCNNQESGRRGTIWICECGRTYLNRDVGHGALSGAIEGRRRYWWRLRWWLPWHWLHLLTKRRLTSSKYHLIGREGV